MQLQDNKSTSKPLIGVANPANGQAPHGNHSAAHLGASNEGSQQPTHQNYCERRLAENGFTEEDNLFSFINEDGRKQKAPLFSWSERRKAIRISYPALNGGQEMLISEDKGPHSPGKEKPYEVFRFEEPKGDMKYQRPKGKGTSRPWWHPALVEKYSSETQVETLFITEGEFKAAKGCKHGLDVVAIPGIQMSRKAETGKLHDSIAAFIQRCQVKNLVLLFDADARQVSFDPDKAPEKDLAKRLNSFHAAVFNFREACKEFTADVYYSEVRATPGGDAGPKGLDDLLNHHRGKEQDVCEDALEFFTGKQTYFESANISAWSPAKLKRHFFLTSPQVFYERFQDQLQDFTFVWQGGRYLWDEDEGKVIQTRHPDAELFVRVGCDWFKKITVINSKGNPEEKVVPWKKTEIKEDYVTERKVRKFLSMVSKYDAFINYPSHNGKYKEVYETNSGKLYNLYRPLTHQPEPGHWPHIEMFLKHVFQDQYEVGLDYLTLLYRQPLQKLPIICLVSRERHTGKSTFNNFLKAIFGANAALCGTNDLNDTFNDIYASKLVVAVDEAEIDHKTIERLKSMSTAKKINMNSKGVSKQEVEFFAKFVLNSNKEDNFAPVDEDEIRFWVIKLKPYAEFIEDFDNKLEREIPAFLYFLKERKVFHPQKNRMWFDPEILRTEALEKVQARAKHPAVKEIKEKIIDMMVEFEEPVIRMTPKNIYNILSTRTKNSISDTRVREILKNEFGLSNEGNNGSYSFPRWAQQSDISEPFREDVKDRGRWYEFNAATFLSEKERQEHGITLPPPEDEDGPQGSAEGGSQEALPF